LGKFLALGIPYLKKGGYLIAMKGKRAKEELKGNQHILKDLSVEESRTEEIILPGGERRYLIFMKKL
jgi:16S rRNA G527 N7-methylase RsmG